MTKRLYVKLQCTFGAGSAIPGKLLRHFGSVEDIFNSVASEIRDVVRTPKASTLCNGDFSEADEIIECCNKNGIEIITYEDKRFPERLRNICDPPMLLYVKGEFPDIDDEVAISVVGPRKPDAFGVKAAFSLSARLAKAGVLVVSGGALGVDSEAHLGALWSGGKTIAVLGCGLLYPYLSENAGLRDKISKSGAVVSEFPPMAPANKSTFPIRNRVMSGLSLGVAVVQARLRSGSLITARHASEQGRDVFVIPGRPGEELYFGSNLLLKDGAKPLLSAMDVLEEYVDRFPHKLDLNRAYSKEGQDISVGFRLCHNMSEGPKTEEISQKTEEKIIREPSPSEIGAQAMLVWETMKNGADSPDTIAELSGLGTTDIITALTELELLGYISAAVGGRYKING